MNTHEMTRRARWKARYVTKQTGRRARSWMVVTASARRPGSSLWLCSWQRSGSTWLAEMLAQTTGTRLVYEPANLHDSTFTGELAAASALATGAGPGCDDVVAAMRGTLRHPWVDQFNRSHVVRRTVVKDVRAMGIAGEVAAVLPDSPIVILTRHPIAVARSVVDLGWTSDDDHRVAFLAQVEQWCEFHVRALADVRLDGAKFVTYEALIADPHRRVRSIFEWAATFDPTWRRLDTSQIDVARPSSTDFRGQRDGANSRWPGLKDADVEAATAIITSHGLDALYGPGPSALCELDEFAAMSRNKATRPPASER